MASKKQKAEKPTSKQPSTKQITGQPQAGAPDEDVRRLLRTAAWSRMFGRASGTKNPFSR